MTYFIRVNGDTLHNDPENPRSYVPREPPDHPDTFFSYLGYCLKNNIIRIGWPDTGDLSKASKTGALARFYSLSELKTHERFYLTSFASIQVGSTILMPDKLHPGVIYIGTVTAPYHYFHDVPTAPYECAHRLGVAWHSNRSGTPICYQASDLNIGIKGGFWTRAFQVLDEIPTGRAALPVIQRAGNRFRPMKRFGSLDVA